MMNFACAVHVRGINIPKYSIMAHKAILIAAPMKLASFPLNLFCKIVHEGTIESIRLLG